MISLMEISHATDLTASSQLDAEVSLLLLIDLQFQSTIRYGLKDVWGQCPDQFELHVLSLCNGCLLFASSLSCTYPPKNNILACFVPVVLLVVAVFDGWSLHHFWTVALRLDG
jgi:hypothetical protein